MSMTLPKVVDVGRHKIMLPRGRLAFEAPARSGMRLTPRCRPRSSSLARSWIQPVTSVSAGPPLVGLYLKPPSSGGLCDGVMTMPSASLSLRPRL